MVYWKDGTPFEPPEDPLAEKWNKLYPPCQSIWDYNCMFCDKCAYGDQWEIPTEDKELWEKHRKVLDEYADAHGGWENLIIDLNLAAIEGERSDDR